MLRALTRFVRSAAIRICLYSIICAANIGAGHATLLGVSSAVNFDSHLYSIDPNTGAATQEKVITGGFGSTVGLASLGGTLYVSNFFGGELFFGTIDRLTGAYTPIHNQGGSFNWMGLAANHTAGVLYTIDLEDNRRLKAITPSGSTEAIGPGTDIYATALAYDNTRSILYALNLEDSSLYTVDTTTGTGMAIGPLGIPVGFFSGLAYDEFAQVLYANVPDANPDELGLGRLYRINTATGAATLIGANGALRIDGLEWINDLPEPDSLLLLAVLLGVLGAQCYRRSSRLGAPHSPGLSR